MYAYYLYQRLFLLQFEFFPLIALISLLKLLHRTVERLPLLGIDSPWRDEQSAYGLYWLALI